LQSFFISNLGPWRTSHQVEEESAVWAKTGHVRHRQTDRQTVGK